jgi:hypothetical protein
MVLACDKWGSRTFDSLWAVATVDQRTLIAEALSQRAEALRANTYGMFIHERCALRTFIARRAEWCQVQSGLTSKRKVLQELAEDVGGQPLGKHCCLSFVKKVKVAPFSIATLTASALQMSRQQV